MLQTNTTYDPTPTNQTPRTRSDPTGYPKLDTPSPPAASVPKGRHPQDGPLLGPGALSALTEGPPGPTYLYVYVYVEGISTA